MKHSRMTTKSEKLETFGAGLVTLGVGTWMRLVVGQLCSRTQDAKPPVYDDAKPKGAAVSPGVSPKGPGG